MRELEAQKITEVVARLCVEANRVLPQDLERRIQQGLDQEQSELGRAVFQDLCRNMDAAREMNIPVCQDTGMAVIFAEVGQEVHINGSFEEAVQEGVRRGYTEGLLRCSVVKDPIRRGNTGDNTPAILHVRLVPGDRVSLTVAPKGFGSENMSRINMFTPSATEQDIIGFVTETARLAGGNACPPMVLGVGIGFVLHKFIIRTCEVDMIMFGQSIRLDSYLYSILLTVLFSVLVNLFMFFKLRKIDMVESLKSVE